MTRQHASPILLSSGYHSILPSIGYGSGSDAVSEAEVQALVHEFPGALPIAEIDPSFVGAVAVCRELPTPAGQIDNLLVTPGGLPVIVECKLWRNPEGRREVVGQILDYAKELSRWSSADLQREVGRRLGRQGNAVLDLVRAADPSVDESAFNDALSLNLRRGRFLLLIVGDGIREGVEAIAEYLQRHAGLHFSLGLVEMPVYVLPNGDRLVVPRVLVRTVTVTRHVVAVPEGHAVAETVADGPDQEVDPDRQALGDIQQAFWKEFLDVLRLQDPEQSIPRAPRQGYLSVMMPAPSGSSWLTVYRDTKKNEVGLFLSASRGSAGEYASDRLVEDFAVVGPQLGGGARVTKDSYGRDRIGEHASFGPLMDAGNRARAFAWLAERTDTYVSVLRPRIRSAVADYTESNGDASS